MRIKPFSLFAGGLSIVLTCCFRIIILNLVRLALSRVQEKQLDDHPDGCDFLPPASR